MNKNQLITGGIIGSAVALLWYLSGKAPGPGPKPAPPPTGTFTLAVAIVGQGTVTKSPTGTIYKEGTSVKLTATPATGYKFDHWEVDSKYLDSANPINRTVMASQTVTAYFVSTTAPPTPGTLTLTILSATGGGCTRSSQGPYKSGDVVKVTAIPDSGYKFDYWERDGEEFSRANPVSVPIYVNTWLVPHFKATTETNFVTLRIQESSDGNVSVFPAGPYKQGDSVEVTARPVSGYQFDYWELDGSWWSDKITDTLVMFADRVLTPHFVLPSSIPTQLKYIEGDVITTADGDVYTVLGVDVGKKEYYLFSGRFPYGSYVWTWQDAVYFDSITIKIDWINVWGLPE